MLSEGTKKELDPHVLNPARCATGQWRLAFIGRRLTPGPSHIVIVGLP